MFSQYWTIKGRTYTRAQLAELRAQGLDPHKDDIEYKYITRTKSGKLIAEKPDESSGDSDEKDESNESVDIQEHFKNSEEESIESLRAKYEEQHRKPVPNKYKNNPEWIKSKLT